MYMDAVSRVEEPPEPLALLPLHHLQSQYSSYRNTSASLSVETAQSSQVHIRGIDATGARALPGVHAVLTADDLPAPIATERMPMLVPNPAIARRGHSSRWRSMRFATRANGRGRGRGEPLRRRRRGGRGRGRLRDSCRRSAISATRSARRRRRRTPTSPDNIASSFRWNTATSTPLSRARRMSSRRASGSIAAAA